MILGTPLCSLQSCVALSMSWQYLGTFALNHLLLPSHPNLLQHIISPPKKSIFISPKHQGNRASPMLVILKSLESSRNRPMPQAPFFMQKYLTLSELKGFQQVDLHREQNMRFTDLVPAAKVVISIVHGMKHIYTQ